MKEKTPRKYIRLCIILPIALIVIAAVVLFFVLFRTACVITVDNETYGIVENESVYEEIVTSVETRASEILDEDYKLDYDVLLNEELVSRSNIATTDEEISEIEDKMFQHISSIENGYVLRVDGELIGIGDEDELKELVDSASESYKTENTKEVEILSDTSIEYESVPADTETDTDNMIDTLKSVEQTEVVYMTQDGDTLEEVAARNDMSVDELVSYNQVLEELVETNSDEQTEEDVIEETEETTEEETPLSKGVMLTISPEITCLTVKTVDEEAYTETIAYETEQVYDNTMYVGTSTVTTAGVTGSADVVDDVTYLNGNEVRRDTLYREVTAEPVTEVVVIGTKEQPQTGTTTQTNTTTDSTNSTNSSNNTNQSATTTTTQSNTSTQTNTNTNTSTNNDTSSSSSSSSSTAVAGVAVSSTNTDTQTSSASTSSSSSSLGAQIAAYAQRFLGCAYVHGGHGPNVFDCSGLTAYVYSQFGITIPWTVEGQYACGTYVPLDVSQMQPGDLIFWSYGGSTPTHVGMYIGNGQYIQATKPGDVVRINTVASYAGQPLVGCRRIVN